LTFQFPSHTIKKYKGQFLFFHHSYSFCNFSKFIMLFSSPDHSDKNEKNHRETTSDRRNDNYRRSLQERRADKRTPSGSRQRLSLKNWFRALIHPRLGVDRRKGADQRINNDRRGKNPATLLTQEELTALLGDISQEQ
jgi:hypothetical protein